ncbi:sugar-transfer associated ATP-grasp domain-containing protein [Marinobacter pelagius]|uniref:Sugar-transfer associated ATP-grasp n=1 Tax=Marinobacter pelagius TaxID=379482 RepID=A0A1I4T0E9_9GAMM|nr:sugar-transfer associated ATP-grasp domain-containing protein [Marinobacter pelagius]SFM70129.1 Sugar-transfer associated ATP-grasp [Marinobacter pelagius]
MKIDLELISDKLKRQTTYGVESAIPYIRRFLRFLALPYCFSKVNWNECTKSKTQVACDFLYIFFQLKYYPDNYSPCRLWEKSRSEWSYYYGSNYDPYQRRQLKKSVQPTVYEIVFRDKVIAEMLCKARNIRTPEIIRILKEGEILEKAVKEFDEQNMKYLIFKPRSGKGGGGITCTQIKDGTVDAIQKGILVPLSGVRAESELIVQEFIIQHRDLSRISKSTNTIRVVTILRKNGDIIIVGTYARFGVGDSKVDNLSQGGICVSVDMDSGKLVETGFDRMSQVFTHHPTSRVPFHGYQIPKWEDVISLAKKVQSAFDFYPLLGMDIAITEEGPAVIEINSGYDNVDLEQATGPILKNPDVYATFKEYDLLINRHQKNLHFKEQGY